VTKHKDFSKVQAMLAIDNPGVRQGLREALKRSGVMNIMELSTMVQVHKTLEEQSPDLLVVSSEIDGVFLGSMIKDMRHSRFGRHPFPLVVVLAMTAEFDYVRRIVDCGPDDILLVPVSPEQMLNRFLNLARERKPFVVTHDYVGPDRRKNQRPGVGKEAVPMVDVPNPVAAKADKIEPQAFQRDIDSVSQRLNTLKVERYGVQIRWLEKALRELFAKEEPDEHQISLHSLRLADIAEDLKVRTANWHDNRIVKSAELIISAAKKVSNAGPKAAGNGLNDLSEACLQTAQEIARSLPHMDNKEMSAQA
jgi:DNA-binding NarL/FixJ family response regulator